VLRLQAQVLLHDRGVFARHGPIIVYAILACVMESTLRRLTEHLRATGQTLATAESCTGGWLAKCLTDLPGSSHWFQAGWVCYSNEAKHRDLGVRRRTLREAGAVSADTVYELAEAALRRSGASFAVAISGIAGPSGAVPGKPVGTVWFGFAQRMGRGVYVETVCKRFRGDRGQVRERAVEFALRGLYSTARRGTLYTA
jgi:nicotinamide-nucleotide amidase